MKRIILFLVAGFILTGCYEQEKRENVELKKQLAKVEQQAAEKDSTINSFFKMLNDIESNLNLIMVKEQIIAKNSALGSEMELDVREKIQEDIGTINELMEENKRSIAYLNEQLKKSNHQIIEFENRLLKAHEMLEARNVEVENLKEQLAQLDFSVEVLNATVDTLRDEKLQLEVELSLHKEALDLVWYAVGSKKELTDNGIIEKAGGFVGVSRSYKLKTDLNQEYFTATSMAQTNSIPLFGKKAQLITAHPEGSYHFQMNENDLVVSLEITDPNQFWSVSKYLVIQLKQ